METLPESILALCALVFVLGLKHGFDADHLATIDGLTRFNAATKPRLARYCGTLFSLGHGLVVIFVALTASALSRQWQTPPWLNELGAWISIGFLTALGLLNAVAVMRTRPNEIVRPVGVKGRVLGSLTRASNPWLIGLIGVLFALSFDTIGQAALFAVASAKYGGWESALMLGALFVLGMLVTDGINGLWISRLIRRADQVACVASRIMGLSIAAISLSIAVFGALKLAAPAIDRWSEGKELVVGALVVAAVIASYAGALRASRPREVDVRLPG